MSTTQRKFTDFPYRRIHSGQRHLDKPPRQEVDQGTIRRVVFERLPTYSPELNVVGQCRNQIKNVEMANFAPKKIKQVDTQVELATQAINKNKTLLPNFLKPLQTQTMIITLNSYVQGDNEAQQQVRVKT